MFSWSAAFSFTDACSWFRFRFRRFRSLVRSWRRRWSPRLLVACATTHRRCYGRSFRRFLATVSSWDRKGSRRLLWFGILGSKFVCVHHVCVRLRYWFAKVKIRVLRRGRQTLRLNAVKFGEVLHGELRFVPCAAHAVRVPRESCLERHVVPLPEHFARLPHLDGVVVACGRQHVLLGGTPVDFGDAAKDSAQTAKQEVHVIARLSFSSQEGREARLERRS